MKNKLYDIKKYINYKIDVLEFYSYLSSINQHFKKQDGSGLLSGSIIEMFIEEYLKKKLNYEKFNNKQNDCKINNHELSIKKISGKTKIALKWSKNKNKEKISEFSDIMLINIPDKTIWWKKLFGLSEEIPAGIFFISKDVISKIKLISNNKSDYIISEKVLYNLLQESMKNKLFIEFPKEIKKYTYKLEHTFI